MIVHDLKQGTPEWHQHRATHFNASDAPAMMGVSPYKTRDQLMKELKFGVSPEIDEAKQEIFDNGHRFERLARPYAENEICAMLYPVVGSDGKMAASFDGLTVDHGICYEHKTLNSELRYVFDNDEPLPLHHEYQIQQQMMVSGAQECVFVASVWSDGDELLDIRHRIVPADSEIQAKIKAGWDQFEKDMAEYAPEAEVIKPVGKAPESLPALRVDVTGMVTFSNLGEFKAHAMEVIGAINTNLQTDEDFADADKTAKWLKNDVEERLEAVKAHALSQTATIDELFRAIDSIKEEARSKRLTLEKAVKTRKDAIKTELIRDLWARLRAHVDEIQKEIIGVDIVPLVIVPRASEIISGLKTISSMRSKLNDALAAAKIEADAVARDVRTKLAWLKDNADGMSFLFPDLQQIISKPMDDFQLVITSRIEKHKADVDRRSEDVTAQNVVALKQTQESIALEIMVVNTDGAKAIANHLEQKIGMRSEMAMAVALLIVSGEIPGVKYVDIS